VAEPEHPAAKAGRFVRAAGRAGLAAARELEKQSAARPKPAPPVPVAPPPPPPALRTKGVLGRAVFVGFVLALVALALVGLRIDSLVGAHDAKLGFRLTTAGVLALEGYLLTGNWRGANQRLGQRLLTRVWGPRSAVTRREKTFARIVRDALTLVGIVFIAAAVFELLSATVGS
jgi:hypothetical protein